jgi:hypothetical protein
MGPNGLRIGRPRGVFMPEKVVRMLCGLQWNVMESFA